MASKLPKGFWCRPLTVYPATSHGQVAAKKLSLLPFAPLHAVSPVNIESEKSAFMPVLNWAWPLNLQVFQLILTCPRMHWDHLEDLSHLSNPCCASIYNQMVHISNLTPMSYARSYSFKAELSSVLAVWASAVPHLGSNFRPSIQAPVQQSFDLIDTPIIPWSLVTSSHIIPTAWVHAWPGRARVSLEPRSLAEDYWRLLKNHLWIWFLGSHAFLWLVHLV